MDFLDILNALRQALLPMPWYKLVSPGIIFFAPRDTASIKSVEM